MSREIVACVASKPRWCRRRRSCSWLWSGSRSISSRMTAWRRAFIGRMKNNYTSIFIDRNRIESCISILSDAYVVRTAPLAPPIASAAAPAARRSAVARVAVAGATGYTGQELLRLLARHPAVTLTAAMSSGQTRRRVAAAAGARAALERHDRAARARRRSPARPTSCSSRCPMRRPRSSRPRSSTPASASSISPAPSGCAATRRARAGIRKRIGCPTASSTA